MIKKGTKKQLWAILLLLLFVSFQAGRTMFYHTHVYGNVIISHSHPFSSNPHTVSDLQSIAALDMSAVTDDINPDIDLPSPFEFESKLYTSKTCSLISGYACLNQGRDPPYCKNMI